MLTFDDYKQQLKLLPFGKKLPEAIYVTRESFFGLDLAIVNTSKVLFDQVVKDDSYNIVKLFFREFKISFLAYPDFWEDAHPALHSSFSIHLATGKMKRFDYQSSKNPPILHRKEEFIPKSHESHSLFSELTLKEEQYGLYENKSVIGFKQNWDLILSTKGLKISGHTIQETETSDELISTNHNIDRYRTAISRFGFSKPVQTAIENGLLKTETSFFDYGCGLGDDLTGLKTLDYNCWGWDPNHFKDGEKKTADIVNLGFVINVIEDPVERTNVLKDAFEYTEQVLIVSCMLNNANSSINNRPFGDGVLTTRNTFQKYFDQDELQHYIQDVLEIPEAVAAAPGVFYVFKDPIQKQAFIARKSKRQINWSELSARVFSNKQRKSKVSLLEKYPEEFDRYFATLVELGRTPLESEFAGLNQFTATVCSTKKAYRLFVTEYGTDILEKSADIRRDDLLVYLALSNFQIKVPFKDLSPELKLDIKSFLGGFQKGHKQALDLLYKIADDDLITDLCESSPFGYNDQQALFIRAEQLTELPAPLRIYVGCAERLIGDIDNIDLIKIHKRSGKVTFLKYKSFESDVVPELLLRIKVNLPLRKVHYFDYESYHVKQLLYHKVRFFEDDHAEYKKWQRHSQKLLTLDITTDGHGPSKMAFEEILEEKSLTKNLFPRRS